MLDVLQQQLADIYQVELDHNIGDFLITDPALAKVLGGAALLPDTDETVLLVEGDDGLSLSVYLDEQMLSRLDEQDPLENLRPAQLGDLWTVLEGISHFNYIAWSAQKDKQVTLLELEMQAEVDKFISTWMMAIGQDDVELADRMHGWLFDDVRFNPRLTSAQYERYAAASGYAARFCHGLRHRLRSDSDRGLSELR
ncbi:MAG TPA: hypothetical protein VKQ06_03350, partial [Gammaproteobacteria bacterium]|nr:hypothetical protein [Gammaproteobacteria bacterium]